MDLVYTDSTLTDIGELRGYRLDIEVGDERNDFELSLDAESALRIAPGALVYADGTEWGGVVDASESDPSEGVIRYTGRTWTGVLADKVLEPDSGQDHLSMSGEAHAVLLQLIERMGLSGRFTVPAGDSGVQVSHTFERYCTGYSGIRAMLAASGAKLVVRCDAGIVTLAAEPLTDYSDGPDTDRADVAVKRVSRPYNHLVSLGSGEGAQRAVRHDYADAEGTVSQVQSLFGLDERTAVYDYSNASAEELAEKGPEKLAELQDGSSWDVSLAEGWEYDVGDIVPGIDVLTGQEVYAEVGGKIALVTDSSYSVEYKAGGTAAGSSLTGSSESSGGGASYTGGYGITIVGRTISADVGPDELEEVSTTASQAATDASNALATAAAAVKDVQGTAPITASVDGEKTATIAHAGSGVTAGAYGPTANLTPDWGDTVTLPPRISVNATGHITQAQGRTLKIPDSTATPSAAGLMSAEDKSKLDAADDTYAAHDHEHSAADITSGTLPIARGGTGASTANAAEYAIIGNPAASSADISDTSRFAMVYATPSATNGTFITRTAAQVWAWIKGKADGLYAALEHVHAISGVTGLQDALDGKSDSGHKHAAGDITSGTLTVSRGGTGVTANPSMLVNLSSTSAAGVFAATPRPGVTGTLPIARGGTGATTASAARTALGITSANIGAAPSSHTHPYAGSSTAGGAADEAVKLQTPRTVTFTGAVRGSFAFDGSENVTVPMEGDGEAANFLAAHPPRSTFCYPDDPGVTYGGTWQLQPGNMGCPTWERIS